MSFIERALIKLAEQVLKTVMNQFLGQLQVIENEIAKPIDTMIGSIVTDGAWKGAAADAFVEDLRNSVLKEVGDITGHISTFHDNLQRASDIIVQADKRANQAVNGLVDSFDRVFVA